MARVSGSVASKVRCVIRVKGSRGKKAAWTEFGKEVYKKSKYRVSHYLFLPRDHSARPVSGRNPEMTIRSHCLSAAHGETTGSFSSFFQCRSSLSPSRPVVQDKSVSSIVRCLGSCRCVSGCTLTAKLYPEVRFPIPMQYPHSLTAGSERGRECSSFASLRHFRFPVSVWQYPINHKQPEV